MLILKEAGGREGGEEGNRGVINNTIVAQARRENIQTTKKHQKTKTIIKIKQIKQRQVAANTKSAKRKPKKVDSIYIYILFFHACQS